MAMPRPRMTAPRVDPETGHGLVTDVCLKRKVRNFIDIVKKSDGNGEVDGFKIYVREKVILNDQHALAYKALALDPL